MPGGAEAGAGVDEEGVPDGAAEDGQEKELGDFHFGDAGGD